MSSMLQPTSDFDGTFYRYRPEKFHIGIEARTIYQPGPERTNPFQKHIWLVHRTAIATPWMAMSAHGLIVLLKLTHKTGLHSRL